MMSDAQLKAFVQQSNLIEGIERKPKAAEIKAHKVLLDLDAVTIADLAAFVSVVQPNARLRDQPGLNVRVGNHIAPPGGPNIIIQLDGLLDSVNRRQIDPWRAHCVFETIHPFSDGNGRSGRALWLWQMRGKPLPPGLFLHRFYYQTLDSVRA